MTNCNSSTILRRSLSEFPPPDQIRQPTKRSLKDDVIIPRSSNCKRKSDSTSTTPRAPVVVNTEKKIVNIKQTQANTFPFSIHLFLSLSFTLSLCLSLNLSLSLIPSTPSSRGFLRTSPLRALFNRPNLRNREKRISVTNGSVRLCIRVGVRKCQHSIHLSNQWPSSEGTYTLGEKE